MEDVAFMVIELLLTFRVDNKLPVDDLVVVDCDINSDKLDCVALFILDFTLLDKETWRLTVEEVDLAGVNVKVVLDVAEGVGTLVVLDRLTDLGGIDEEAKVELDEGVNDGGGGIGIVQ